MCVCVCMCKCTRFWLTYSEKLYSSFLHEFCLAWHVLEIVRVVEKFLLFTEENLPKFDGALPALLQPRQYYPAEKVRGVTEKRKESLLCFTQHLTTALENGNTLAFQ